MKRLLLLLLLCPVIAFAKFKPGIITFTNDNTVTGWVEMREANDPELRFREEEEGKSTVYTFDDVKKFTINSDGELETYIPLRRADMKTFKKQLKEPYEKRSWVKIIALGEKANVVMVYFFSEGSKATWGVAPTPSTPPSISCTYYLWKPDNDYCTYLYTAFNRNPNLDSIAFKQIKMSIKATFGKECPELVKKLDKDDLLQNGLQRLVELYAENCGNTK